MKRLNLLLIITLNLIYSNLIAQSWDWAKSVISSGNSYGYDISTDTYGNVVTTGAFYSDTILFDSIMLFGSDWGDVYIAKYDDMGNVLWAKSAGGNHMEAGKGIATDNSNNIYVAGHFSSDSITFDSITLINSSIIYNSDLFIVKFNEKGILQWSKSVRGNLSEIINSITIDDLDNVYLTGSFCSNSLLIDSVTLINPGGEYNTNMFIAKYNSNGNLIWAKNSKGSSSLMYNDVGNSVSTDNLGNAYVTGSYTSDSIMFDNITLYHSDTTADYHPNIYIVKYNINGNAIWAKSVGGDEVWEHGVSVTTDISGNVYVTGDFRSSSISFDTITLKNNGIGNSDIFIAKFDSNGNVIWAKNEGGDLHDYATRIRTDFMNNILLCGYFISDTIAFNSTTLTNDAGNITGNDMFLARYDSNGNFISVMSAVPDTGVYTNGLATDLIGNVYLTGDFYKGDITFGSSQLTTDVQSMYIAKMNYLNVGIKPTEQSYNSIILYPNPFKYSATLEFENQNDKEYTLNVYDIMGKQVQMTNNITTGKIVMQRSTLNRGVYFLQIKDQGTIVGTVKFIIIE